MQLGDAAIVAIEDRHEIFRKVVLILAGELAHDAEIQRDETRIAFARGIHPNVAGVCIGMEKIIAKHLLVKHPHTFGGQGFAVDAGGVQRLHVIRWNTAHALHRHCTLGRMRPDDFRHVQVRRALPIAAQQTGVAGFALQVKFSG